jgi:hypothetical protein
VAISEDFVKTSVHAWLTAKGYTDVQKRLGTRRGDDVSGKSAAGRKIWVECKGETAASDQWRVSWGNLSDAFFKALDQTVKMENATVEEADIVIAVPDTENYRDRMAHLEKFCRRQNWNVLWVSDNGHVQPWF